MSLESRIAVYREIERYRERPLIVYVTSSRPNAIGTMGSDVVPEILDQLEAIPSDIDRVDLLVVSQGGDPTVAWRVMSLLRERFEHIGVLVPQSAFSAATMLCLGADEIVMHPHGNLGPIDPQVTVRRKGKEGTEITEFRYGYEEVLSFLQFLRERASISDQSQVAAILTKLFDEIGTSSVGVAIRGSMLSLSLGENLLRMHMTSEAEGNRAQDISEALNKKFLHHGYAVGRDEARKIGLKVRESDPVLESLMWKGWSLVERDLLMRVPFNAMGELANYPPAAPLFAPLTSVTIPQGLPAAMSQQLLKTLAATLQPQVVAVPPLDCSVTLALVESVRESSQFVTRMKVFGSRQADGGITLSKVETFKGWEKQGVFEEFVDSLSTPGRLPAAREGGGAPRGDLAGPADGNGARPSDGRAAPVKPARRR